MTINSTTGMISWTPTAAQIGSNTVDIKVADPHESLTRTFNIVVTEQQNDQPPTITSKPTLYAVVGDVYRYNLKANDPGNYPTAWTLNFGPAGMVLDSNTNSLEWTPNSTQIGFQTVTVEVNDSLGGVATQTFQIDTLAADLPPTISSQPSTQAGVGVSYSYQVVASSAAGFALTYSLQGTVPAGMQMSPTGLLTWPNPTPVGSDPITILVSDLVGLSVTQSYTLVVSTTPPGIPPVITTTPPFTAGVSVAYPIPGHRNRSLRPPLTYAWTSTAADFSLNTSTRVVSWTPTTGDVGTQTITITATDTTLGLTAVQTFNVSVINSQPPTISSGSPADFTTHGGANVHLPGAGQRPRARPSHLFALDSAFGDDNRLIGADHLGNHNGQHRRPVFIQGPGHQPRRTSPRASAHLFADRGTRHDKADGPDRDPE